MDINQKSWESELDWLDFSNMLRRYKKLLLVLPLVGAAFAALLVFFVLPPRWEASALLEIGHVGQSGQASPIPIEPIPNVVERMKLPSFARTAINYAGIESGELKAMQDFYGSLKVVQAKHAELVEIKLKGPSPEMAKKLIQGAITSVQKVHGEMMSVSLDRSQKQLQLLVSEIQKSEAEMDFLKQKLLSSHNWNTFDATLASSILQNKISEHRALIEAKLALEEQLSPLRSYTTKVMDEIYVSELPVSPNKPLIIGVAIVLGLFCAVAIAFGHNAFAARSIP